jgi:hypothetical protein
MMGAFRGRVSGHYNPFLSESDRLRAHFFGRAFARPKKPGFPLQVLGSADALPVGFPLQSHCARPAPNAHLWMPSHTQMRGFTSYAQFASGKLRGGSLRTRPGNCLWQFPGRIIAAGNYAPAILLRKIAALFQSCRLKE